MKLRRIAHVCIEEAPGWTSHAPLPEFSHRAYICFRIYTVTVLQFTCPWLHMNRGSYFFIYLFVAFLQSTQDIKRVISKKDGCEYFKQVPFSNGSLELI
jgi:hypothetical protein